MNGVNDIIFLDGKIPIKTIQLPFCYKCMDHISSGCDFCLNCENPPSYTRGKWFFNCIRALGIYSQIKYGDYLVPINLLSELLVLLKFKRMTKFKKYAGSLLADGLFQIVKNNIELFQGSSYIITSPKFSSAEKNNVEFIIRPLLPKLNSIGFSIDNITYKAKRNKDIGQSKSLGTFENRFEAIGGVHDIELEDLHNKKVILIDDIITSGSTAWDLSRALKDKNAGDINILAAGKNQTRYQWPITKFDDFSFDYLMLYFSKMDFHRDIDKIEKCNVEQLEINGSKQGYTIIEGSIGEYVIKIDFNKKILTHKCDDFVHDKMRSKKFCKHISKLFMEIKNMDGEENSKEKLLGMYQNLDRWDFSAD